MEKKVRYLMLLLCLCLLPFRVYALESEIPESENNSQSNVVVESKNDLEEDNQEVDSSIEKDEEEKDIEADEKATTALETAKKSPVDGETPTEGEQTPEGEQTDGEGEENEGDVEQGLDENVTVLEEIHISGVPTELVGGETFTFSGTSEEPEKYTIVAEKWDSSSSSASSTGSEVVINPDEQYDYSLQVRMAEGYSLIDSGFEGACFINGTEYGMWAYTTDEEGVYEVYTSYSVKSLNKDATYEEGIEITNAILTPYVGENPLYGAKINNEHFTIYTEAWSYDEDYYDEEGNWIGWDRFYNASNASLIPEGIPTFTTFIEGKYNDYVIILEAEDNYRIASQNNAYSVTINGSGEVFVYEYDDEENGKHMYEIYVPYIESIVPDESNTHAVTENANPTITAGEAEDVTIGIEGDFSTVDNVYVDGSLVEETNYEKSGDSESTTITFLSSFLNSLAEGIHNLAIHFTDGMFAFTDLTVNAQETTTTNDTSTTSSTYVVTYTSSGAEPTELTTTKIEVKKDKKDKEEDKTKEKKEDEETTSSNLGLIIFLIILVTIAIAIPITVYRKKQ